MDAYLQYTDFIQSAHWMSDLAQQLGASTKLEIDAE